MHEVCNKIPRASPSYRDLLLTEVLSVDDLPLLAFYLLFLLRQQLLVLLHLQAVDVRDIETAALPV